MSKPGYIIVRAEDTAHLEGYVNDAIKNGYVPTGGPVVMARAGAYEFGSSGCVIQAMVLHDLWKK